MKPLIQALSISFCLSHAAIGQSLISRWQYEWGGNRQEFLANMIPLPGNQYLFAGTSASDPSCTKSGTLYGDEDMAIFILDDNGNKIFEKTYGGDHIDQVRYIAKVPAGGYILVGYTESGPSGIKTSPSYGGGDIWVVRIDDNFNLLWENTFGGSQYESACKVVPTPDGGFLVGGISLSPYAGYNYGSGDYLVLKLDANGNQVWAKNYGGWDDDELQDILPMPDGNFLLSGFSGSPYSGNKKLIPQGANEIWTICIAPDGTMIWENNYGPNAYDYGGTLLALQDGNYLITAYSMGTGILRKIDRQGNQLWVRTCSGLGTFVKSTQSPNGDIYVGGNSSGDNIGCKTSPLAGGLDDIWIAVFDAAGNKIGDMDYGGNDVDLLTDIQVINGELWIVGWTDSYRNGNKTVDRCGQTADGWIIRATRQLYIQSPTPTDICSNITNAGITFTAYSVYQAGNVFTAQLSDATGSFATFTDIGTLTSTTSGVIAATLPSGLLASDQYKIRVVASLPADTTFGYPLSIHGLPLVQLGNDTTICENKPLTLTIGAQPPGTQTQWNDGSAGSTLTVSSSGIYSCDVQNSCGSTHSAIQITAKPLPIADIGNDKHFCEGTTLMLQSAPQPPDVSYIWNDGAVTPSIQVNAGGKYWLHTTNTCGTTGDTILVTMDPRPVSRLDKDSLLCYGTTRTLDAGQGFPDYLWNDGQHGETHTVSTTGLYWVQITGNDGCISQDTVTITRIMPLPAAFLPQDTSLCSYEDITLTSTPGFQQYTWSTGESSPSLHVTRPGLYWLEVSDRYGCSGRDSILISPKECPYGFFMPSAFTPNQDGHNDLCRPLLYGRIGSYTFAVYNRWGQKIFETSDPTRGWDGYVQGNPAEAGAFVWTCSYKLGNSPEQHAKGVVMLVR